MKPGRGGAELAVVVSSSLQINGVTTAGDRMFGVSQGDIRGAGFTYPQLFEISGGRCSPYPDDSWAGWQQDDAVEGRFVGLNSIRVGPDGTLRAVDRGSAGVGTADRPRTAPDRLRPPLRLRGSDLRPAGRDQAVELRRRRAAPRRLRLPHRLRRPGPDRASPAHGRGSTGLEGRPATIAQRPLRAEHRDLVTPAGSPVNIHVDQLEVSPDGTWLYFQPCCGSMSRVPRALLDDSATTERALSDAVEAFAQTASTGGTAIADDGTIYVSHSADSSVIAVAPDGRRSFVVQDVRLAWADAKWIDDDGCLLIPSAQLNRGPALDWGIDNVMPSCTVFAYPTDKGPSRS